VIEKRRLALLFLLLAFFAGCNAKPAVIPPDSPRLTTNALLRDITFHSAALNRDMQYRVIMPASVPPDVNLPVLYLLHGGGGGFRDWSNYSDIGRFTESGFMLVMPEGHSSYYVNAYDPAQNRYADYLVQDLVKDVEARLPAMPGRAHRAIAGVSMGGFGAVTLALKHPEIFGFAAGVSPAIDVPSRPFSLKRPGQYYQHRKIFGPWGSDHRRDNDPFYLVRKADPAQTPYLYLSCGDQEGLLPSNRKFAELLKERKFLFEFHVVHGGHNWEQWNARIPEWAKSLMEHLK
jgi:putative tributyrin esterase